MKSKHKYILIFFGILGVTFWAYGNALTMDFIGDDLGRVLYAEALRSDLKSALFTVMPDRPLLTFSLWLNQKIGGFEPVGFKTVNIVLHAVCAFLVVMILTRLHSWFLQNIWVSAAVGMLFGAHPLNNQAVNSISQRGVLLAALFSLLSLLIFMRYSRTARWTTQSLVFICAMCAILSKTNAFALPLVLSAFDYLVNRRSFVDVVKTTAVFYVIWIFPLLFYFGFNISEQYGALSAVEYSAVQVRALFLYLKLFVVPMDLHFLYDFSLDGGWSNVKSVIAAGFLAVLSVAGALLFRRGYRLLVFFLSGMFLCFLPESSFFPIRHVFFEHRAYLPLAYFLMGSSFLLTYVPSRIARFAFPLLVGLVGSAALANRDYNEKIHTYEKWVFYNYSRNPNDADFNIFVLQELGDRDAKSAETLARRLITDHPKENTYPLYLDLFEYSQKDPRHQREFLLRLREVLPMESFVLHRDARLKLVQFYGIHIASFLPADEYWFHIEDFFYDLVPVLRRNADFNAPLFAIYYETLNRVRVADIKSASPPDFIRLRILLALKYFFKDSDETSEKNIKSILIKHEADPSYQELERLFSKGAESSLPTKNERIE